MVAFTPDQLVAAANAFLNASRREMVKRNSDVTVPENISAMSIVDRQSLLRVIAATLQGTSPSSVSRTTDQS